jgi:hypothetical protein
MNTIQGSIHQHSKVKFCIPTNEALHFRGQKPIEVQGEIDKPTILVGKFNTFLSIEKISRKEIIMGERDLNSFFLIDFYKTPYYKRTEHIL